MPSFPNTGAVPLTRWSNFHHTIVDRAVPQYLTPGRDSAEGPGRDEHPRDEHVHRSPKLGQRGDFTDQRAVWRELKEAKVRFACHWGQEYGMDQASVRDYYGLRIERWKHARLQLLDSPALRAVFTNPLLVLASMREQEC
jgi:hypothetical protein